MYQITATTATLTNVSSSATSVSLLAANVNRKMAAFFNDSTANLFLAFAATATTSAFTVKIPAAGYFEMFSDYTGAVSGIWDSANGAVRITEVS